MAVKSFLLCILLVGAFSGSFGDSYLRYRNQPRNPQHIKQTVASDRISFPELPLDILTKWGPFGYFNEYVDPSNSMGPEILKGFGVPFNAYNGFNIMESVTLPPLEIPADATTTSLSSIYGDELFSPTESSKDSKSTTESPGAAMDKPSTGDSMKSPSSVSPYGGGYMGAAPALGSGAPPMPQFYGPQVPMQMYPQASYQQPMRMPMPLQGPHPYYNQPYYGPYAYPAQGRNYYVRNY